MVGGLCPALLVGRDIPHRITFPQFFAKMMIMVVVIGDSGDIVDSDEDYHFYDTGDDNDGCLITNQYNCRDFETFQPCTGFSDRISFVDC